MSAVSEKKIAKHRQKKMTEPQKDFLIQFVERNPKLLTQQLSPDFTKADEGDLWKLLTEKLNVLGSERSTASWKLTLKDYKARVRTQGREIYKAQRLKTGGGPAEITYDSLSPRKQRLLAIMGGSAVIEGEQVEEKGLPHKIQKKLFHSDVHSGAVCETTTTSGKCEKRELPSTSKIVEENLDINVAEYHPTASSDSPSIVVIDPLQYIQEDFEDDLSSSQVDEAQQPELLPEPSDKRGKDTITPAKRLVRPKKKRISSSAVTSDALQIQREMVEQQKRQTTAWEKIADAITTQANALVTIAEILKTFKK